MPRDVVPDAMRIYFDRRSRRPRRQQISRHAQHTSIVSLIFRLVVLTVFLSSELLRREYTARSYAETTA